MIFADWLTPAQKSAIADVAIASSELEAELERCIIELCRLWWPHGAILLANVRLDARLGMLYELLKVEYHDKAFPADFQTVYTNLKDLNAKRNTIIHGEWILSSLAMEDRQPGSTQSALANKSIVARRRKRAAASPTIAPREVRKIADLLTLNREFLHQLFWEHFSDRVRGLSGLPTKPAQSSAKIKERVRKRLLRL